MPFQDQHRTSGDLFPCPKHHTRELISVRHDCERSLIFVAVIRIVLFLAAFSLLHCAASEVVDPQVIADEILATAVCSETGAATCTGSGLPDVALADFQPDSETLGDVVNLQSHQGKVTLIALFAGW